MKKVCNIKLHIKILFCKFLEIKNVFNFNFFVNLSLCKVIILLDWINF